MCFRHSYPTFVLLSQVDWVLERMSRAALRQHTQRRSGRWKWPDTRDVPRQAGLLPRLGNMLGERGRWPPLPRLAAERHPRRQRRMVHWVCSLPFSSHPLSIFFDAFFTQKTKYYRASKEEPSRKRHKITEDGYNLGRDWFVERALAGSYWKGHNIWWSAQVEWRTGLLEPGSKGTSTLPCALPGRSKDGLTNPVGTTHRRQPRHPAGRACRRPHCLPRLDSSQPCPMAFNSPWIHINVQATPSRHDLFFTPCFHLPPFMFSFYPGVATHIRPWLRGLYSKRFTDFCMYFADP